MILETMVGYGHSWEAVSFTFVMLEASVRSSKAYMESEGASPSKSTSRNSPGQTVVDVGRECTTMAQPAVELIVTGCWNPQLWIVPSPRITQRLAGHTAISLDSLKGFLLARTSASRFSTTRPSKVIVQPSHVKGKRVSPTTCSHLLGGRIGN